MFIISHSCDCFRPYMKRNRATSMCSEDLLHVMSTFMTYSRFLLNVCFVIGNLSWCFVIMCRLAASLHLHLLNVSHWVYDSMQTHAIPYSFFGSVVCISRSREHNCPSYVLLGRKMIFPYSNTQADIREFESNDCLECCHEVRSGRQNVHANKVYAGMEKQQIGIRVCKLSGL